MAVTTYNVVTPTNQDSSVRVFTEPSRVPVDLRQGVANAYDVVTTVSLMLTSK